MNNAIVFPRVPAEWDKRVDTILLAFPDKHTDWSYMLDEVQQCFIRIISVLTEDSGMDVWLVGNKQTIEKSLLTEGNISKEKLRIIDIPYNDTWARDFGPITYELEEGIFRYIDFKFNGWGLKFPSDMDNQICRNLVKSPHCKSIRLINRQNFVLEGGSIESDGKGTILTTSKCLLSPNRNAEYSKEQIEHYLKESLKADRVLWLDHGYLEGDDTDSHIDTLARLVSSDTIAYVKCYDSADTHFSELEAMEIELKEMRTAEGKPYNLIPLPLPNAVYDVSGNRLPATYANFLITPRTVLVPVYNQQDNDTRALYTLEKVFPEHKVIGIDCNSLIKQHGSLHCVTMQMITK